MSSVLADIQIKTQTKKRVLSRILFVIGSLGNGGAEKVCTLLSNRLYEQGVEVYIVTIFDGRIDYSINKGINIKHFFQGSTPPFLLPMARLCFLNRCIRSINPNCVVSFLAEVNLYTVVAMMGIDIKLILSERNDPRYDPPKKWKRVLRNKLYRFCDGIIFQTNNANKYFSKFLKKNIVQDIIFNPISPGLPTRNCSCGTKRFITACRLDNQKNLPMMISAIAEIIDEGYDCTLDIYGRGPLYDEMKALIEKLDKNKQIHLCEFSMEIAIEMSNSDAFIITSDYEGLSNSMLEALVIGIPVIATDCNGVRDFVHHGENGFVIPVRDKKELKRSIMCILRGQYDLNKITDYAKQLRETLDVDRILNCWIATIEKTLLGRIE